MGEQILKIKNIINSPFCIASEDGEKVYNVIKKAFEQKDKVQLSFEGIEDLTSAFLNAAVGQLYNGDYQETYLKEMLLPPINIAQDDLAILKRVVERAKEFFKDPERFRKAAIEVLGDEEQ